MSKNYQGVDIHIIGKSRKTSRETIDVRKVSQENYQMVDICISSQPRKYYQRVDRYNASQKTIMNLSGKVV